MQLCFVELGPILSEMTCLFMQWIPLLLFDGVVLTFSLDFQWYYWSIFIKIYNHIKRLLPRNKLGSSPSERECDNLYDSRPWLWRPISRHWDSTKLRDTLLYTMQSLINFRVLALIMLNVLYIFSTKVSKQKNYLKVLKPILQSIGAIYRFVVSLQYHNS